MGLSVKQIAAVKKEIPLWVEAMRQAGYSDNQIYFSLPQTMLETGYFLAKTYLENNNPGGIKFKPKNPAPDSVQGGISSEGDYYAKFLSKKAAAVEHLRIIKLLRKTNPFGAPVNAKDFTDFATRLYYNGYYGGYPKNALPAVKIKNYANGMIQGQKYILQYVPDYLKPVEKKK